MFLDTRKKQVTKTIRVDLFDTLIPDVFGRVGCINFEHVNSGLYRVRLRFEAVARAAALQVYTFSIDAS